MNGAIFIYTSADVHVLVAVLGYSALNSDGGLNSALAQF